MNIKEYIYKVVLPSLMHTFNIKGEQLKFKLEDVIIDPNAPTSYYDPEKKVIVLNPKNTNEETLGEELTHYLRHAVFGKLEENYIEEFVGYVGRYALLDALGIKKEIEKQDYTTRILNYLNNLPNYILYSTNDLFNTITSLFWINKLKLLFYITLLSYLKEPNEKKKELLNSFIEKIKNYYNKINEEIIKLSETINKLEKSKISPGTLDAIVYNITVENVKHKLQYYKSLKKDLEEILICPDSGNIEKYISEKYSDILNDLSKNMEAKLIESFKKESKYSYPMCILREILDNKKNNKEEYIKNLKNIIEVQYSVLKDIENIFNEFKGEIPQEGMSITIKDIIGYISLSHSIGYDYAKKTLQEIRENKISYEEIFWDPKKVLEKIKCYINEMK